MELEQIREKLSHILKKSRYLHSLGVEETAGNLAILYGYDMKKARIAGILHDCAKHLSEQELLAECTNHHIPISEVEKQCPFLLHAKVGAFYAGTKYGINDEEILNAITYHTTGRPSMSLLERIIFIADYVEPNRGALPGIDQIRMAAGKDLDSAVVMILENTLNYLLNHAKMIDTMTLETYHYYTR